MTPKFYWHASTSSGGTLSLGIDLEGEFSELEKKRALADALGQSYEYMKNQGYIPFDAKFMSSRDIAKEHGKTRQYWEKLLNEGKILYKETSAGRITTNLWVMGYIGNKEAVDRYVKNVRTVLKSIDTVKKHFGETICPICDGKFEYAVNQATNVNGICRGCGFHVHTTK